MLENEIKQIMKDEEVKTFLNNIKEKLDLGEYLQKEIHQYMLDKGYYKSMAKPKKIIIDIQNLTEKEQFLFVRNTR